jgi:serine/threonine protein kinase
MHQKNIFHQDLKPSNIFITLQESSLNPVIKLANFGVYRIAQGQDPLPLCFIAGSKDWMAPEVYESETYTAEMDLFAMGLLIGFSLSGGRHPFGRIGSDEVSMKIRLKLPVSLTAEQLNLTGKMASQVFELIKELLNVDPSKRPSLDQVLDHPFFKKSTRREERILLDPSETGTSSFLCPL